MKRLLYTVAASSMGWLSLLATLVATVQAQGVSGADLTGRWRLENSAELYDIVQSEDGAGLDIYPLFYKMCTADGVVGPKNSMDPAEFKAKVAAGSMMNRVFDGAVNPEGTFSGTWVSCATLNHKWIPRSITFHLDDGGHLTGPLDPLYELDTPTLTFTRVRTGR